jgi:hypothetical protein
MGKLELYVRPLVIFDPSNKEHRQLYWNYLATGSWMDCPYRFAVQDDHGHLMGHIQRLILEWYMTREFKGEVKDTNLLTTKRRYGLPKKKKNG